MMGRGRKIQERDLLLGIYCYYPEGESYSTAGNAYVGCIYPIRAVYARASRMCVSACAATHGCALQRASTARIPFPSDCGLSFCRCTAAACIISRVIEQ